MARPRKCPYKLRERAVRMVFEVSAGIRERRNAHTAAVAWAREAGAPLADHQPQEHVRVMLDPDGHPFCLFPGEA